MTFLFALTDYPIQSNGTAHKFMITVTRMFLKACPKKSESNNAFVLGNSVCTRTVHRYLVSVILPSNECYAFHL